MSYSKIIVAVDLSADASDVIRRAKSLADGGSINLVHVLEPLAFAYGAEPSINLSELHDQLETQARNKMNKLASEHSIDINNCHLPLGSPADEIHLLAKQEQADIIVIGSHGRSGLSLLLGSTANAVVHGANCDVLAVRVKE